MEKLEKVVKDEAKKGSSKKKPLKFCLVMFDDNIFGNFFTRMMTEAYAMAVGYQGLRSGTHKLDSHPESYFSDGSVLPENAVVYVHGNSCCKYDNVGYVRQYVDPESSQHRPDLRFIVKMGSSFSQGSFENPEDYVFLKSYLGGETFDIAKPVNVLIGSSYSSNQKEFRQQLIDYFTAVIKANEAKKCQ